MPKLVITKEDVAKTLEAREKLLQKYVKYENTLGHLFTIEHPQNVNYQEALEKARRLNSSYSTHIIDIEAVANHIVGIKKVDDRIKDGDPTVVHEIAQVFHGDKKINHFSFATKYCSFHNPASFPIYDKYLYQVFSQLRSVLDCGPYREETIKQKDWNGEKDCGYLRYKKVYVRFIELFGDAFPSKDYRTIDHYIWTSRKIASMNQENKLAEKYPELYSLVKFNAINSFMKETH